MSGDDAVALLADLRRRNVRVSSQGDRLQVRAPRGAVSERDRDALGTLKPEVLERLKIEARLLYLPLDEFAQQDYSIELAVPWLPDTIWFVPRVEHIDDLIHEGVHRGRIWTTQELRDLLSLSGLTERDLVSLSRFKIEFDGEVLVVANAEPTKTRSAAACPCRACGEARRWLSIYGATVCGSCHPPASPSLVARWIEADVD